MLCTRNQEYQSENDQAWERNDGRAAILERQKEEKVEKTGEKSPANSLKSEDILINLSSKAQPSFSRGQRSQKDDENSTSILLWPQILAARRLFLPRP